MSSIVDASDPSYQQLQQALESQKRGARIAQRRKGERPKDFQTRAQCISDFNMASMSQRMSNLQFSPMIMTSVTGNPYPPSNANVQDLKKIMIKDLMLEFHHRGSYLLLRFVCQAMRMNAVMNLAEDECGTVIPFAIYMQEPEAIRSAGSILLEKSVIILKEPYFKLGTTGKYAVRVDQPTDIIWLADDDSRVPAKWRVLSDTVSVSAVDWKKKGNDFVGKAKYYDAIEMYAKALRSAPSPEDCDIIHRNRALAYLRIEAFDAALNDISCLSDPQEKGLYRKGLALYGLGRFEDALDVFQSMVEMYPESTSGKQELNRCRTRIAEQKTGAYDFKALYKATKLRPPRLDIATYKGPVEVRASAGRGRGLHTTAPVKAGDILLCEKAFAYCFAASPEEIAKMPSTHLAPISFMIDVARDKITMGTHADLIRVVSNKLTFNPSLKPTFEDLYSGDYQGVKDASADGSPVIDTFLVARAVHFNCFGCPLTSKKAIETPNIHSTAFQTTGLWMTASYINHSCVATCERSFIGDIQIVRAARDMPAGTELMFSYITLAEPAAMNKTLLDGWGFECDCVRCADDRSTSSTVKTQRQKYLKNFKAPDANRKRKQDLISQLNKTYQHPSTQVPRFQMWALHMDLVEELAQRGETDKMIDGVLAAFESVGFIIEGAKLSPVPSSKIIVRQWGAPNHGATSAWLTLRNIYKDLGLTDLAEQTKEFARITWMLLVGDDTQFVYDNPPKK
ncbi:related to TPR domain protein [Rhynchosporium secalis]|uniref:Related to TPR domain protein n=1 Tax=Rhynchosporium secalis TaxID=38038 RepID=A0A1E1LZE8_RHYSE|nr:related to TPR domain protein [Rhynchosporium secalis]